MTHGLVHEAAELVAVHLIVHGIVATAAIAHERVGGAAQGVRVAVRGQAAAAAVRIVAARNATVRVRIVEAIGAGH